MNTSTSYLTPYDTGAVLEPKLHPGTTGLVDFDNDESSTLLTIRAIPTKDEDGDSLSTATR